MEQLCAKLPARNRKPLNIGNPPLTLDIFSRLSYSPSSRVTALRVAAANATAPQQPDPRTPYERDGR